MVDNASRMKEYLVRRVSPEETYEKLLDFPRYIEIETTNACNARCPMCTISDWRRSSKPMTEKLFARIAKEIVEHADEIKRVTLYRNGEPLLDDKLPDRIAMLKKGGVKCTSISTNISLLTELKAKELLNAGIDIMIMSIDSLNKSVYERIRKGLDFDDVLKKAIRFIELRNMIRPQTKIWMRMIRQKSNYNEWPGYRKYWEKYLSENDRVYYHNVFNWGSQLSSFEPISKSYEPNLPCVALWSLIVILCNGDVPLCNADYKNLYPTGSVISSTIAELWRSEIMEKRRQKHLSSQKAEITLCGNCNVWDESPDSKNISTEYAPAADIIAKKE